MTVPILLLLAALAAAALALVLPSWAGLALPALSAAAAALLLVLRAAWRRAVRPGRSAAARRPIVVDGSNVMYWRDNTPRLDSVKAVVDRLSALGYAPGVVFDANAGHLLAGRYLHDREFGRRLGLPTERVMVVPKGMPADPVILHAARSVGARIVTNDRYRDWAEAHPEVHEPGRLIGGGYRSGDLRLELD